MTTNIGFHFKVNVSPKWHNIEKKALEKAEHYKIKVNNPEDLCPIINNFTMGGTYYTNACCGKLNYNIIHSFLPNDEFTRNSWNPNAQSYSLGHYSFGPYVCFGLKHNDRIDYFDLHNKYINQCVISPTRFLGVTYKSGTLGLGYISMKDDVCSDFLMDKDGEIKELQDSYEPLIHFPMEDVLLWLNTTAIDDEEFPKKLDPHANPCAENWIEYKRSKLCPDFALFQNTYNAKSNISGQIERQEGSPGKTITLFSHEYVDYKIYIVPIIIPK
jgi:hypothetical protein